MDDKRNQNRILLFWAMVALMLSSTLATSVKTQANDSRDFKFKEDRDEALLEDDPSKCPIGQECQDQSQVYIESDTTDTSQNTSCPPGEFLGDSLNETKGNNSGINSEKADTALNDAPADVRNPGAGKPKSRSKGGSKADKRLRRKNRRRKCRERRRKRKLERKMRKGGIGGGKGNIGGKGINKRQGKKGKKLKRRGKCGRRGKGKGRKRKKNNKRKGGKKRLNKGRKGINNYKIINGTLVSILEVQESGEKNAEMKSKQKNSDSSQTNQKSVKATRPSGPPGSTGEIVIDSNKGVLENADVSSTREPAFDAVRITSLFQEVIRKDSNGKAYVDLENYIKAYGKLVGVFQFFGTIFSFAKSDLEDKINTLGELRRSSLKGQNPESYQSFKNMFEYEYAKGIAQPGGDLTSGVRENAWIHRALKFIIAIIRTIADQNDTSSLSSRVRQFYSEILAPHHSWLARMGVYAAIPMFPSRETLLKDMQIRDDGEGMRELTRLANSVQAVYDSIQVHYEKYASSN